MEDMGIPMTHCFEIGHHLNCRSAEERKPIEIIGVIDTAILIEPGPVEERIISNRPHTYSAITLTDGKNTFFNWCIDKPLGRRYSYTTNRMEGSARLTQATIVRDNENNIMAKLRQLKRQRTGNVSKTTSLSIGYRLRGDHEQIQTTLGHRKPRSTSGIR